MKNHEIVTFCRCGCGDGFVIKFRHYCDQTHIYLETITSGFYSRQNGFFQIIKFRIKAAWFMLTGKEYLLHEIMLDKREWNRYVDEVNKVGKLD